MEFCKTCPSWRPTVKNGDPIATEEFLTKHIVVGGPEVKTGTSLVRRCGRLKLWSTAGFGCVHHPGNAAPNPTTQVYGDGHVEVLK